MKNTTKNSNILLDMNIIVDTREKKNEHILNYFESYKIPYTKEKLDIGDYSFILPNFPELNLDKKIVIERKNSLDELAGNFTKNRDRFEREFERIQEEKVHLVVENATFKKMLNGSYRSNFNPNSYLASLLSFSMRYDLNVWFATTGESPVLIYKLLYYGLYNELLKNN